MLKVRNGLLEFSGTRVPALCDKAGFVSGFWGLDEYLDLYCVGRGMRFFLSCEFGRRVISCAINVASLFTEDVRVPPPEKSLRKKTLLDIEAGSS